MTSDEPGRPSRPEDATVGELLTRLSDQTTRLVRDEIALAQLELRDTVKQAGTGAGLLSAGAVLALFGLGAGIATAIIALALVLPLWASALIVTVVVSAAAGIAALVGKREIQQVSPTPERAVASVQRDVQEVKEARHRDHTR